MTQAAEDGHAGVGVGEPDRDAERLWRVKLPLGADC